MDSDLCCPVCKDLFDDKSKTPRHLGCGHSLCSVCLEKLLRKKPFCPECRKRFSGSQLNDFTISYPLLRLACSARNLEKDLTSENYSTTKLFNSRKNVGDCISHGCSLFFWCSHHCVWVCRDCLVLDHQRPPHGSCQIIAAEDAIDIVKKIQVEKIVSKFKELELLKSMIEDELKDTEDKRTKCNDSRNKFDEWERLVLSEIDSSMDNYKKYLSNVGILKTTLSKLKCELNSDLIFDNVVKMVKNATEILDNLAQNIVECRKIIEQTSCKSTTQDTAFFMFENKAEVTDKAVTQNQLKTIKMELTQAQNIIQELKEQASVDSNLETIKSELMAAHLQIKEFKKQTKAQEDMRREINKWKDQLNNKSLEMDSLREDISRRSIHHLSLENQLKSLKLDRNDLNQKINKLNETRINYDKEILNLKENLVILENKFKNQQVTGNDGMPVLQDQLKKANIEINALEMRLKESVKHQNSLIKKIEDSDAKLIKIRKENDEKLLQVQIKKANSEINKLKYQLKISNDDRKETVAELLNVQDKLKKYKN